MRQYMMTLFILLFSSLNASFVFAQDRGITVAPHRVALVIGNSQYMDSPLANPVNDARAINSKLRKLGFNTTLLLDASQREMEEAIASFGQRMQSGDVGMFYYAGHGMQIDGQNYLIPVDASIRRETDVKYESVHVGRVLDEMAYAQSKMNIVVLDACRNNPVQRSFRNAQKGLAQMNAPTGTILVYSTAPGSVAADGEGMNGVYTESLLRHIETPGITIEKVLKRTRADVLSVTQGQQVPWESSSLTGDFFFKPGTAVASAQTRYTQPLPVAKREPKFKIALPYMQITTPPGWNTPGYAKFVKKISNYLDGKKDLLITATAHKLERTAPVAEDVVSISQEDSKGLLKRDSLFSKPKFIPQRAKQILDDTKSNTLLFLNIKRGDPYGKATVYAYNNELDKTFSCTGHGKLEIVLQCTLDKLQKASN